MKLCLVFGDGFHAELDGGMLLGDRSKLTQVLRNMLSNAIKFTKHHSGDSKTVTVACNVVTTASVGESRSWNVGHTQSTKLQVQVVDTGPGISQVSLWNVLNGLV